MTHTHQQNNTHMLTKQYLYDERVKQLERRHFANEVHV